MNNDIKQVIVVRKDLGMRQGKVGAQCAHASMKVILDLMKNSEKHYDGNVKFTLSLQKDSSIYKWISGTFTKVVVYVNSEDELIQLYQKANESKIPSSLIKDIGKTEFHNVPTYTCCAIGPGFSETIDLITGKLPLL